MESVNLIILTKPTMYGDPPGPTSALNISSTKRPKVHTDTPVIGGPFPLKKEHSHFDFPKSPGVMLWAPSALVAPLSHFPDIKREGKKTLTEYCIFKLCLHNKPEKEMDCWLLGVTNSGLERSIKQGTVGYSKAIILMLPGL